MTDITESWLLFEDSAHSPQKNMDIDVELLELSSTFGGRPLLRFYDWDRPSASVGYVQKEEIVPDQDKYTVVRRPTGGGVVYHDIDFTYTVVVPKGHWIEKLDRVESYHVFHRAIVRGLKFFSLECLLADSIATKTDRATMQCFVTPTKYDVLCTNITPGTTVKVAGSAQRRTKNGILHQGSITLYHLKTDRKTLKKRLKDAFESEFNISFEPFSMNYC